MKILPILMLAFLVLAPVAAQTVEVCVIEDVDASTKEISSNSTNTVVEGVLDTFFDTGIITIDIPQMSGNKALFDSFEIRSEAKDELIDYSLVILTTYMSSVPECSYKIVRVSDNKEMISGKIVSRAKAGSKKEISIACKELGKQLASECIRKLRESSFWRAYEKNKA